MCFFQTVRNSGLVFLDNKNFSCYNVNIISVAATGAVQGAVEGYQETGTLEGTLRGMGKGAMKGAVEGAKDGLISGLVSGAFAGAAMSMSGNPMFCFVAGTTVLTSLGKKAIENIQVGDVIPCVDHITGETAEKRVVTTTVNKVNKLIELDIDKSIIPYIEPYLTCDNGEYRGMAKKAKEKLLITK